jgi:hypothetical protein
MLGTLVIYGFDPFAAPRRQRMTGADSVSSSLRFKADSDQIEAAL